MTTTTPQKKLFAEALHREFLAALEEQSQNMRFPLYRQLRNGTIIGPLQYLRTEPPKGAQRNPTYVYTSTDEFLETGKLEMDKPIVFLDSKRPTAGRKKKIENSDFTLTEVTNDEIRIRGKGSAPKSGSIYIRMAFHDYNESLRAAIKNPHTPEWPLLNSNPDFKTKAVDPEWEPHMFKLDTTAQTALERLLHPENLLVDIVGPPGTGKTKLLALTAAMMAKDGLTVCITSRNHVVVNKALAEAGEFCQKAGLPIRPAKSGDCEEIEPAFVDEYIAGEPAPQIWGATIYSLANLHDQPNNPLRKRVDVLIIDEAGQVPCFHAAAISFMAKKVCLFGDPDQLKPILNSHHPQAVGTSIMEYIRVTGGAVWETHFAVTQRMNSAITKIAKDHYYPHIALTAGYNKDTRLDIPSELQSILGKHSACFLPVHHTCSTQYSEEEAKEVVRITKLLLQHATFHPTHGAPRKLVPTDFIVVSPHKWQASVIQRLLQKEGITTGLKIGVATGTVDKMQGQDAVVVIYSLTQSNIESIATLAEWLFEKNRLNVAITRAKAKVIVLGNRDAIDKATPNGYEGNELRRRVLTLIDDLEKLTPADGHHQKLVANPA